MSAVEDDTELRDLVIQNLENSGVLNKMKAEMRAAVFLAMEDQDRLENKVPPVNERLKRCLNSRDGRLAVALIVDFLQVFSLDFSLAVFLPEINSPNGVDSREVVCRELGLQDSELDKSSPLLLELLGKARTPPQQELPQNQIQNVQKTFNLYKNQRGLLQRRDLKSIFTDLFPSLNEHDLDRFFADELQAADQEIDFQFFLLLFKRLLPRCSHAASEPVFPADKEDVQQLMTSSAPRQEHLVLDLNVVVDLEEGDSFFDDPLPKPQKTYGCPTSSAGEQDLPEGTKSQQWRDPAGSQGSHAESLSADLRPGGRGGGGSREGASDSRDRSFKAPSDRTSSLHLDEDFEYDDDFHSHRSELSKSEQSIDEEIQEVSIEGPSDSSNKLEETTLDMSVSQLSQVHAADFIEDVS